MNSSHLYNRISRATGTVLLPVLAVLICLVICSGCSGEPGLSSGQETQVPDTGYVLYGTYDYDSVDTAVLVDKNTEEMTLTFLNTRIGRRWILSS